MIRSKVLLILLNLFFLLSLSVPVLASIDKKSNECAKILSIQDAREKKSFKFMDPGITVPEIESQTERFEKFISEKEDDTETPILEGIKGYRVLHLAVADLDRLIGMGLINQTLIFRLARVATKIANQTILEMIKKSKKVKTLNELSYYNEIIARIVYNPDNSSNEIVRMIKISKMKFPDLYAEIQSSFLLLKPAYLTMMESYYPENDTFSLVDRIDLRQIPDFPTANDIHRRFEAVEKAIQKSEGRFAEALAFDLDRFFEVYRLAARLLNPKKPVSIETFYKKLVPVEHEIKDLKIVQIKELIDRLESLKPQVRKAKLEYDIARLQIPTIDTEQLQYNLHSAELILNNNKDNLTTEQTAILKKVLRLNGNNYFSIPHHFF